MAVPLEQFVKQLEDSGIVAGDTLKDFLPPKSEPKSAEELALELVRQKKLTKFQAEEVSKGKGKSLTLGNYVLMEKIGAGGMGQVFKAEHRRMKRVVAVKLLPAAMTKDKAAIARFEREVQAAAKLRHPNIIAADDADQANGVHFLVMELVEGSDLSALIKKNGPFPVDKAVNYILQAAKGLEFAHAEGVVHRDIKPANLLLDKKGTVKILDMGLARIHGDAGQAELTSTGAVMGTVDYMAPEQALNTKTADARADIYSLGCSLYYLLTGKATYDGDTLMAKLLAHRDQTIPDLRVVCPQVAEPLELVFKKMVAKKIEDRYQSMTEVIADLEGCGGGLSNTATFQSSDAGQTIIVQDKSVSTQTASLPSSAAGVSGKSNAATTQPSVESPADANRTDFRKALSSPATSNSIRTKKPANPKERSRSQTVASPPWWQDRRVQIGGGAAAVLLLLAVVFLFQTPNGTLRVEILDPEVEMKVKGTELTFQGSDLEPVSLKAGEKKLLVTRGDLSFETEGFTLKKGRETRVKVELVGDKLVVNGGGKVIAEQPIQRKGLTTSTTGSDPAFSQWLKDVQAMPAEKQLEAVSKKLVELNPGFDGKLFHHVDGGQGQGVPKIEKGLVTELHFYTDKVTDLSPVRAFSGLKTLSAFPANIASELTDLSPLQGMQLTDLVLAYNSKLSDISPLKGMRLTKLAVRCCAVTDLAPLKGMPLATLDCDGMKTTDLSPLQGMPLQTLDINHTLATDFTPLKGMPLDTLYASFTKMGDLSVLHKMPLTTLEIPGCPNISDLSPLKELPLKYLGVDFKPDRDADILRSIKTLERINGKSAAEFWAAASGKLFMHDPAFQQWMKDVQAMPAEKQLEAVSKKLVELNPGFDGKLYQFYNDGIPQGVPKIENGVVTELHFFPKRVTDISPVRALKGLKVLSAIMGEGELTDISPLQGMQLTTLFLWANPKLSDLSPLAGMPLTFLISDFTSVSDLSPLKGMKFTVLRFAGTKVTDISLIREMPLKDLNCNFQPERDTELLKSIKTLERINGKPAAEFWKEVEEQQKKQ